MCHGQFISIQHRKSLAFLSPRVLVKYKSENFIPWEFIKPLQEQLR